MDAHGDSIVDGNNIVADLKTHLNNSITSLNAMVKAGTLPQGITEDMVNGLVSEYQTTLNEISTLEKSDQIYNVAYNGSANEGGTSYNDETGQIDIGVAKGSNPLQSVGLAAHELKHGYQFETGNVSFAVDGKSYYYTMDGQYLGENKDGKDLVSTVQNGGWRQIDNDKDGNSQFVITLSKSQSLKDVDGNNLTHTDFLNFGALIYAESSGVKEESYAIASAVLNFINEAKKEGKQYSLQDVINFEIPHSTADQNRQGKIDLMDFKDGVYGYRSNARFSNGAVINALNGGKDYSNGATHWDGGDLAALGMNHRKPKNGGINIAQSHLDSWNSHYKKGKTLNSQSNYSFQSTSQYGGTLFWKIAEHPYKKNKRDYFSYRKKS